MVKDADDMLDAIAEREKAEHVLKLTHQARAEAARKSRGAAEFCDAGLKLTKLFQELHSLDTAAPEAQQYLSNMDRADQTELIPSRIVAHVLSPAEKKRIIPLVADWTERAETRARHTIERCDAKLIGQAESEAA